MIKLNKTAISSLKKQMLRAMNKTAKEIKKQVIQANVTPFADGTLQGSTFTTDAVMEGDVITAEVVADEPYARRIYFNEEGFTIHQGKNPNAKDHWLDNWTTPEKIKEISEIFNEKFNGGLS